MRTVNDDRGDEPGEDHGTAPSSDGEATRVFSRDGFTEAPTPSRAGAGSGTEDTREVVRDASDDSTREFRRDEVVRDASGDSTREFTRGTHDDSTREFRRDESTAPTTPDPSGAVFTKRFVRDRPPSRDRDRPPPATGSLGDQPWGEESFDEAFNGESSDDQPFGDDPFAGEPSGGEPFDDEAYRSPTRERGRARERRTEPPEASEPPRPLRHGRRRFRLRWVITLLLLAALALPPTTWGWVWYVARQDDRVTSDAIIVLGASQYNGVPSPVFEARLRHAQVLYLEGVAPMIVTVGGKLPDDNFTEAISGKNWLVDVGIPADQVIAVEEGRDTLQSIDAVSVVFAEQGWDTAILVSDPWHSLRSQVMAADFGIDAGTSPTRSGPAVIERSTQLWYITRETAALWYYWIFDDSSDIDVNAA